MLNGQRQRERFCVFVCSAPGQLSVLIAFIAQYTQQWPTYCRDKIQQSILTRDYLLNDFTAHC